MPSFLFNAEYNVAFSFFTLEKISHPSCFLFLTKHNAHTTKFDLAMTNWTQLKTLYFLNSARHDLSSPNNIWSDFFTGYVQYYTLYVRLAVFFTSFCCLSWSWGRQQSVEGCRAAKIFCQLWVPTIVTQIIAGFRVNSSATLLAPHSAAVLVRVQLCGYSQDLERVHHFSTNS